MRCLTFMALLALALAPACGKNDKPPAPTSGKPGAKPESGPGANPELAARGDQPTATPVVEAQQLFGTVCATCHGSGGMGDGPAAESLTPKPRNYSDPAWQASVTDADIAKIIVEGGQAVGKSGMMPAQSQLKERPEVVAELVKLIRGFAKK